MDVNEIPVTPEEEEYVNAKHLRTHPDYQSPAIPTDKLAKLERAVFRNYSDARFLRLTDSITAAVFDLLNIDMKADPECAHGDLFLYDGDPHFVNAVNAYVIHATNYTTHKSNSFRTFGDERRSFDWIIRNGQYLPRETA